MAMNGSSSVLLMLKVARPSEPTDTCFPVQALPLLSPEITSQYVPMGRQVFNVTFSALGRSSNTVMEQV